MPKYNIEKVKELTEESKKYFSNELSEFVYYRCVAIGTKVLTSDLRWIPAEELTIGDKLLGFDENVSRKSGQAYRRLKESIVLDAGIRTDQCYEVTTDLGKITVSTQHPFLARNKPNQQHWWWKKVEELQAGSQILVVVQPWEEETGDTWLAGIADGEGTFHKKSSVIAISQNVGNGIEERIGEELKKRNFEVHRYIEKSQHIKPHAANKLHKTRQVIRFLGQVRPKRLLNNWLERLRNETAPFLRETPVANVISIKPVGKKSIVNLETSTKTFIAEGFACHNTYSRWIESEGRRETWVETVNRYMDFMRENLGNKLPEEKYYEIRDAIVRMEIMPSMRLMWSAGDAARKTNVAGYNCSYIAPTKIRDLGEILYILMCGAGVGFSVEEKYVQQFPQIKYQKNTKPNGFTVEDSKEGWANALIYGITEWYEGYDVTFDFSKLREMGARLQTMGGKSAGPEPLKQLLVFAREKILNRQGKRLTTIDLHDIICKIGECVVMGGVRRSSLISLSDLDDSKMRNAKQGAFFIQDPQRSMANNSAVYTEKPDALTFIEEMLSLARSRTGERGIFNRYGFSFQLPQRRLKMTNGKIDHYGTNPCGEINLRSKQFCNLSEVICRKEDTFESLKKKVELATIVGTYQATLTSFPFLSEEWKENCEKERLLGVSLTGQWDCELIRHEKTLEILKDKAIAVNKEYSERFDINPATAITCVKPSGTVSQLVDSSSGIHPRYAKYYIRRVRISNTDALFQMLKEQGYPFNPENGQEKNNATTFVLDFPVKAPEGAITKDTLPAIKQLEHWLIVKRNYTEHNPSCTVYVADDEWLEVMSWVYKHWRHIGGLSFLPKEENHVYSLAPYEEINETQYNELIAKFPKIDFSQIVLYEENSDNINMRGEMACTANGCELI